MSDTAECHECGGDVSTCCRTYIADGICSTCGDHQPHRPCMVCGGKKTVAIKGCRRTDQNPDGENDIRPCPACQLAPACTEPAPSAVSKERLKELRDLVANATYIGDNPHMHSSDSAHLVALLDELESARARIAALEAGVRKWASECAGCNGTSKKFQYVDERTDTDIYGDCDQCADIRALLPAKEQGEAG